MKLYYFDLAGRAECARIMLKAADMPFEDVRFSRDEWIAKYKAMSPTGQCPMLELDDGSMLCQSTAINWYVAAKTGFIPSDAVKQARVTEIVGCFDDVFMAVAPTFGITDVDERIAARKALLAPGGKLHEKLTIVNKLLGASGGKFCLGDDISLADMITLSNALSFASGMFEGFDDTFMAGFDRIAEVVANAKSHPKIAPRFV